MKSRIIKLFRKLIYQYDKNNGLLEESENIYICENFDTRNRYKNDKYKIPFDKPQCPIFNDSRCCGSCRIAPKCEHAVNCGCYGYTYARLGGNDKGNYMHKATEYYQYGRLNKEGKFDWTYYKTNKLINDSKYKKFTIIKVDNMEYVAEIKNNIKQNGKFKCYICDLKYYKNVSIKDMYNQFSLYRDYDEAKQIINIKYKINYED